MDLSTVSVLKIGIFGCHPKHLAHEFASCISLTEMVTHTLLLPHAMHVEVLVHAEVVARQKILA